MENRKRCSKCKKMKLLSEFFNDNKSKDSKRSECKDCHKKCNEKYRKDHEEYYKKYNKEYKEIRKEHLKRQVKKYHETYKEQIKEYNKEYRKNNKEEYNEYHRERNKDPFIRLNKNISSGIWRSLCNNKNGKHWETIVGYTKNQLKKHLEQLFTEEMNWNNYGKWHIDHKIPISFWKFTTTEDTEFKQCWSLCNLQPLWAEDNFKKSNKVV